MSYVDGFVAAVTTTNRKTYEDFTRLTGQVFKDAGALSVVDCWGEDVPDGQVTSFPMAVKCKPDETVVFGWIVWPDKATREAGMAKAMKDPRMSGDPSSMPFDGKRMIFGGFEMISET